MSQGYATYGKAQVNATDPRDVEYRLLADATARLQKAKESTDPLAIKEQIAAAIQNGKVWAALKADLGSPENQLPKDLRASIISVAIYIEKETNNVMAGKGDIDTLIYINRQIMGGLKPESRLEEDAAAEKPEAPDIIDT